MARRKRTSPSLDRARTRLDSLKSIDPNLDLGNGKTVPAYDALIKALDGQLSQYNTDLSVLDGSLDALEKAEASLDAETEAMLASVGVKFTKDSTEYEKAGGTRKSERKRRTSNGKSNGNGQPQ